MYNCWIDDLSMHFNRKSDIHTQSIQWFRAGAVMTMNSCPFHALKYAHWMNRRSLRFRYKFSKTWKVSIMLPYFFLLILIIPRTNAKCTFAQRTVLNAHFKWFIRQLNVNVLMIRASKCHSRHEHAIHFRYCSKHKRYRWLYAQLKTYWVQDTH